jgi:hypothetical protein
MNQTRGYFRDFLDRGLKRFFVGLRRFVETGDFADELERRRTHLFWGDGRIKIEKRFDIPAHGFDLGKILAEED